MATALQSIISAGTKLWLDSVDPDLVLASRAIGATGATSNPIIVSDLIKSGRFDDKLEEFASQGLNDSDLAWAMVDFLVGNAQQVFKPVYDETKGNDGYVSFELDPLLEDVDLGPSHDERVAKYVELGKKWAADQPNRMIKVPATPAGLEALKPLAAAGVTLNVTLIFTPRQYEAARDAIWAGAQQRVDGLDKFKSVYSIFVSRVDVYTVEHVPELTPDAQGLVGIVNAKQIYQQNKAFWADKNLPLEQEMIFASTGTKNPSDPKDKYVAQFVGSDIQTNPPSTNEAIEALGKTYDSQIESMPAQTVIDDIAQKVDYAKLEEVLMREGLAKFADPQKALLKLISEKRASLNV